MCDWEKQGVLNGGTKEPKTTFSPLSSCGILQSKVPGVEEQSLSLDFLS